MLSVLRQNKGTQSVHWVWAVYYKGGRLSTELEPMRRLVVALTHELGRQALSHQGDRPHEGKRDLIFPVNNP
jgi:hypothetical protein